VGKTERRGKEGALWRELGNNNGVESKRKTMKTITMGGDDP